MAVETVADAVLAQCQPVSRSVDRDDPLAMAHLQGVNEPARTSTGADLRRCFDIGQIDTTERVADVRLSDARRVRPTLLRTREAGLAHHEIPCAAKWGVTLTFAAGRKGVVTRPIRCAPSALNASETASDAIVTGSPVLSSTKLRSCAAAVTPSARHR